MALNNDFKIKNNLNTLGQILSSGVDIASIFSPANTTFTVAANTGNNFTVAGGQTETFTGINGINTSTAAGTRTVTISGVPATTSSAGVASFNSGNFSVTTNGAVSIKNGGVGSTELGGAIDSTTIGATTPSTGRFTTLTTTGAISAHSTIDAGTGFRVAGSATSGQYLRGNGTNFVSSAIQVADVPTLNQNTTGSAATLTTSRNIWGQAFNGSADVTGNLSNVGNITGSAAITVQTSSNGNITLSPDGTGVVATSKAGITGGNIDGTVIGNTTKAAGSFTTLVAVDNLTANTAGKNVSLGASTSTGQTVINSGTTGTIDNIAIGNTTRSSGKFTTLDANNAVTLSPSTGTVTINPTNVGALDNVVIGATTPRDGSFTNIRALSAAVDGNLFVGGTLFLAGSATTINQNQLVVDDPIIYLANSNPDDSYDIGFVGHNVVSGTYSHTGLLRSHGYGNPGTWYLFSSMTAEPSANSIDTNAKVIDTLVANTSGTHTGNSTTATTLQNARNFSLGSGDVTSPTVSFDGSGNVALATTIANNAVTYSKFQQVAANSVVGNPTGSTANAQAIPTSSTGLAVLSATNAAAAATTIGLGTSNSVTFKDVTINNGSVSSGNNIFNGSVSSNNTVTIATFDKTAFNTVKYIVQIKRTGGHSAACEILVNYNTGNTTWEGTVYGLLDTGNIFTNVDVATTSSTIDLVFTFNGNANYSVTIAGQAI